MGKRGGEIGANLNEENLYEEEKTT